MLIKMEVENAAGDVLSLPLSDTTNGYAVQNIDGLDPVKATIVSSAFARLDGMQYQSSRREARNVLITVGLEPDYANTSVRALRARLYQYLMPKTAVTLSFYMSDGSVAAVMGRVESFTALLFAQEPSVEISVLCFDPDFVDPTVVTVSGTTKNALGAANSFDLNYTGDVETGVIFKLSPMRTLSAFTIYHTSPDGSLYTTDFAAPLTSGMVLTMSSIPGQKKVTTTITGFVSSVLYGMAPQANWITLLPGINTFNIYAEGAAVPYQIIYNKRYGGL